MSIFEKFFGNRKEKVRYDYRFSSSGKVWFCMHGTDFGNVQFAGSVYTKDERAARKTLELLFNTTAHYYSEVP